MLLISGWYYWFKLWFCWYWKKSRYTALHLISIQNILDELKWFIYYLSPLFNFHAYLLSMIITIQMFPMITTVIQNELNLKYRHIVVLVTLYPLTRNLAKLNVLFTIYVDYEMYCQVLNMFLYIFQFKNK